MWELAVGFVDAGAAAVVCILQETNLAGEAASMALVLMVGVSVPTWAAQSLLWAFVGSECLKTGELASLGENTSCLPLMPWGGFPCSLEPVSQSQSRGILDCLTRDC